MRRALNYLTAAVWGVLLLGGAFRPPASAAGEPPRPSVGYAAPPFTLTDAGGRPVSLAEFSGRAVFLNFWASWCGPCRMEMPEIQRLAADLPPETVILTVNMTAQESSANAPITYLAEHGYTFPVLFDTRGLVGDAYRVLSLPTSLFLGPDGTVRARVNGPLTRSAMADYLKAAGR